MSKKTITIFTQARKWRSDKEFTIEHNTIEHETSEYALYITLDEQSVEVNTVDTDSEKLTLAHIEYLKSLKIKVHAEAQIKQQNLDIQINDLLALDVKEVM